MVLGNMVRDKICTEVAESGAFTLLAKDVSKTEQLSIVLGYVRAGRVHERFFGVRCVTCAHSYGDRAIYYVSSFRKTQTWICAYHKAMMVPQL